MENDKKNPGEALFVLNSSSMTPGRQTSAPLYRKDYKSLFLIGILSTIQGLVNGFCAHSLIILLAEKGIPFSTVGILMMAKAPIGLKMFLAPIVDAYYSKRFGRRKSYLVPCELIIGSIFLYLHWTIDGLIENIDLTRIFIIAFGMMFFLAFHNVAVQGLTIHYHGEQHHSIASATQIAGDIVGKCFAYFVLVPLSSARFCKDYLNSPHALVPLDMFMLYFGIYLIIVALGVTIFVDEGDNKEDLHLTYIKILRMFQGFYRNKLLRRYVLILLFARLGYAPTEAILEVLMIQKGFLKENISIITSLTTPVPLFVSFIVGRLFKRNHEWTGYLIGQFIHIVNYYFQIFILSHFNYEKNYEQTYYFMILNFLLVEIGSTTFMTSKNSFDLRIAEKSIEGSYFTMISSITRLGEYWPVWVVPFFINKNNFFVIQIAGGLFVLIFWTFNFKFLLSLQTKSKEEFKISNYIEEDFHEMVEENGIELELPENRMN